MYKSIALRFLKAFVGGAVAVLTVTTVQNASSWTGLGTALTTLGFAATIGGISGVILAAQKYFSWTE